MFADNHYLPENFNAKDASVISSLNFSGSGSGDYLLNNLTTFTPGGLNSSNQDLIAEEIPAKKSSTGQSAKKPPSKENLHENIPMDTPNRYELDARLEAIEARMDARMAQIESFVSSISQSQTDMRREVDLMRQESKADNKSTRVTMIVTGVSAVLAIVIGVAAFNATVLSNMIASFESGKNTVSLLANTEKSLTQAARELERATSKLSSLAAAPTTPTPTPTPTPQQ